GAARSRHARAAAGRAALADAPLALHAEGGPRRTARARTAGGGSDVAGGDGARGSALARRDRADDEGAAQAGGGGRCGGAAAGRGRSHGYSSRARLVDPISGARVVRPTEAHMRAPFLVMAVAACSPSQPRAEKKPEKRTVAEVALAEEPAAPRDEMVDVEGGIEGGVSGVAVGGVVRAVPAGSGGGGVATAMP